MDSKNMEDLLKKYWACETTLEEEKQLREYFGGNNIPDQWKDTAALFRYFEETKKKSLNDLAFESQVIHKIHAPKKSRVGKTRI